MLASHTLPVLFPGDNVCVTGRPSNEGIKRRTESSSNFREQGSGLRFRILTPTLSKVTSVTFKGGRDVWDLADCLVVH